MNPTASAVVGVGILAAVASITIAAILRYSVDDAVKIWTLLSGLVGVVTGSFITYFFTRQTNEQATQRANAADKTAEAATKDKSQTADALQRSELKLDTAQKALDSFSVALEKPVLKQLMTDHPAIKKHYDPEGKG